MNSKIENTKEDNKIKIKIVDNKSPKPVIKSENYSENLTGNVRLNSSPRFLNSFIQKIEQGNSNSKKDNKII